MSEEFPVGDETPVEVPPAEVPPAEDPTAAPPTLRVDDFVQVRRTTADLVEVAEGYVTATSETTATIGARVFDTSRGWSFEIIRRIIDLPDTLCEINATLLNGQVVHLMGRGVLWSDVVTGQRVDSRQVRSYEVVA